MGGHIGFGVKALNGSNLYACASYLLRARTCWLIPLLMISMAPAYGQQKTASLNRMKSPPPRRMKKSSNSRRCGVKSRWRLPIGSGDVLHIEVFDVPELARDVRVDPTGMISLPLIPGKIQVAGLNATKYKTRLPICCGRMDWCRIRKYRWW